MVEGKLWFGGRLIGIKGQSIWGCVGVSYGYMGVVIEVNVVERPLIFAKVQGTHPF